MMQLVKGSSSSSSSSSNNNNNTSSPTVIGPRSFPTTNRTFYEVSGTVNPEKMETVAEIFHRILTPLYGPQDKAIGQIRESKDRRCYLLYENDLPMGVLVFKTVLSNEFADYGLTNSIEIKSLFVDNSNENSGRGIGSDLAKKVMSEAENLNIGHSGLHVTVSENKQDSLTFFQKKGFKIAHEWKGRYIEGTSEYLLSCPRELKAQGEKLVNDLAQALSQTTLYPQNANAPLIRVVHAHLGDIHILMSLPDGSFVSGAKDSCIYKWNDNGAIVREVEEVEPSLQNDAKWITAADRINRQHWVTGRRDGSITLWRTDGERARNVKLNFPKMNRHISHELNQKRITCMAKGLDPENPTLFVGAPTEFEEYSLVEGRSVASTVVDKNDWPYCIFPLTEELLLLAIAGRIEGWKKSDGKWNLDSPILREGKKVKNSEGKLQRPFISSLKALDRNTGSFVISDFAGTVKQLDLTSKKVLREWQEHQNRVWTIEPLSNHTFASCGEDGNIKLWDIRQSNSTRTISESATQRQVNTLLGRDNHLLIAGTSTSTGSSDSDKRAQLRFYDLRK